VQELPTRADGGALERRKSGELTALEVAARRRNRRWMGLVLFPSLIIGAVALITVLVAGSGGSPIHPAQVPAGYQAVSDHYFAYAVPSTWSQSSAYTDDVGDLDTQGQTGWVAEHLGARATPPTPGESPPLTFATFGESRNVPYRISPAVATTVRGASVAYRYTLTRSGGFQATAVDAWQSGTGAEIWMLVHADPAITSTVLASLNG
jgi:hypothetical protein